MICPSLDSPNEIAELLADLEGKRVSRWRDKAAYFYSESQEEPGSSRLWIIPNDVHAGDNPERWIRTNAELFNELVNASVVQTNVVCAGETPRNVTQHKIPVQPSSGDRRPTKRNVRSLSATHHLWIDRLRCYTPKGDLDDAKRREMLQRVAGKNWTAEHERSFVTPVLESVSDESIAYLADACIADLTQQTPTMGKAPWTVIYGHGGAGKTFLLRRVANRLASAATQSPCSAIPVFVELRGILHKDALETWLSRNGFGMLTLSQLQVLVRRGVIVALLDALDEVVKGEAREGSEEFLDRLFGSAPEGSRGVLACRDYYLTADRNLMYERARNAGAVQLLIGPFKKQDIQPFLQARTGLKPEHAKRWAEAFERQAEDLIGEMGEVIRHPVVLDSLAKIIVSIPDGSRVRAADEFRLSRPDIFGEIVDELLKREELKHAPQWREAFGDALEGRWLEIFGYESQRDILQRMCLLVAADGGTIGNTEAGSGLRHGVFLQTKGVPPSEPADALPALLRELVGEPSVAPAVPEEKRDEVCDAAVRHLAEAFAQHILADNDANPPTGLIFALKHRFYFDYFLAAALIREVEIALTAGRGADLVHWCLAHNVTESFATCLDFLSWDPRITHQGLDTLRAFFAQAGAKNDVLASYLLSLGLAILLRRRTGTQMVVADQFDFAPASEMELALMNDFLPELIAGVTMRLCSFPCLSIGGLDLTDVVIQDCDLTSLSIGGTRPTNLTRCTLDRVDCGELVLGGRVRFRDCTLNIKGELNVREGASIELFDCRLSPQIHAKLESLRHDGTVQVRHQGSTVIEDVEDESGGYGWYFLRKLMKLVRKHGHEEFGVYIFKLRARTPGTPDQFAQILTKLIDHGAVRRQGDIVIMTPEGAKHLFPAGLVDEQTEAYWQGVVAEIDTILAT